MEVGCLFFMSNAKRMEAIQSMINLLSGEFKEGGKKSQEKNFIGLVLTYVTNAYRKLFK